MSPRRTVATTKRVLKQLRHDHRTLALILFVPSVLLTVLYYVFNDNWLLFGSVAPLLLGIFPFTLMFIVTSVAVLRERMSGTLERLLVSPATKQDILCGYALAFTLLALVQASIASFVATVLLGVVISGGILTLLLFAGLAGMLGMAFGLLFSAFAKNEFQAVQFMPAFVMPQFLTCGLFIARDEMARPLQYFSDVMPITYADDAMKLIRDSSDWSGQLTRDLLIMVGFIAATLVLGALSLRSK